MPSKNSLTSLKPSDEKKPVLQEEPVVQFKVKVKRINKGFQVEESRVAKWNMLVAKMKSSPDKMSGPELMDEAMDYLFAKYLDT